MCPRCAASQSGLSLGGGEHARTSSKWFTASHCGHRYVRGICATVSRDCWLQKWQRILRRSSGMVGGVRQCDSATVCCVVRAHARHQRRVVFGLRTILPPPSAGAESRRHARATKVLGLRPRRADVQTCSSPRPASIANTARPLRSAIATARSARPPSPAHCRRSMAR